MLFKDQQIEEILQTNIDYKAMSNERMRMIINLRRGLIQAIMILGTKDTEFARDLAILLLNNKPKIIKKEIGIRNAGTFR